MKHGEFQYKFLETGRYRYSPPKHLPVTHELETIGACVQENVPITIYDLAALLLWVVSIDKEVGA